MSFLVDTNVISELRKGQRANSGVREWFEDGPEELYLSVLVMGELRRGIQLVARCHASPFIMVATSRSENRSSRLVCRNWLRNACWKHAPSSSAATASVSAC